MSPEQEEELRERYRKNFLQMILLPPEAIEDEFPELVARCRAEGKLRTEAARTKGADVVAPKDAG